MSQPDLSSDRPRGVLVRKPRSSVYTWLLFVALLALVASSLLMMLELMHYEFQFKPPADLRSAAVVVSADLAAA